VSLVTVSTADVCNGVSVGGAVKTLVVLASAATPAAIASGVHVFDTKAVGGKACLALTLPRWSCSVRCLCELT